MNNDLSVALMVLIFLGSGLFAATLGQQAQQRETYYRFECAANLTEGNCIGEAKAVSRLKVLLLTEQQTVVLMPEGAAPSSRNKCTIYDADNWQCDYEAESRDRLLWLGTSDGKLQSIDGFADQIGKPVPHRHFYGPAWKWYLVKYLKVPYNRIPL